MIRRTTLNSTELDPMLMGLTARCIYMHVAEPEDQWVSTPHAHNYHELCYVVRGRGTYSIGGLEYSMDQDDLFLLPAGVPHGETCDAMDPFELRFFIIDHSGEALPLLNERLFSHPRRLRMGHHLQVRQLINQIHDEIIEQGEGYLACVESCLKVLYALIYRELNPVGAATSARRIPAENLRDRRTLLSKHIREYVLRDMGGNASVDELARHFHYHPKYMSQRVKQETGMPLSAFLLSLRLSQAQELLAKSQSSVADIARSCGFPNASYFYRSFRELTAMTPSQYRDKMHNAPRDNVIKL